MIETAATVQLSGNPRRGTLLMPPRPEHEVIVVRTAAGAEVRFGASGRWTHANLTLFPAAAEIDGVGGRDEHWGGEVRLDGYRFGMRADPQMRELHLLDGLTQPHHGPYCAVTEDGRVVVAESQKSRRKQGASA